MFRPALFVRFGFVVTLAAGFGCSHGSHQAITTAPSDATPSASREMITIPIHGAVTLRPLGATIAFTRVDDGRCPLAANCIRADYVIASLTVTRFGGTASVNVGAGYAGPGPVDSTAVAEGLLITYVNLLPGPQVSGPLDPASYRVELAIEKPVVRK